MGLERGALKQLMDSQQWHLVQKTAFPPAQGEFLPFDTSVCSVTAKMRNWSLAIWLPKTSAVRQLLRVFVPLWISSSQGMNAKLP